MMAEEFQFTPPEKSKALHSALIVGFSALVGSLIPLFPFFFWTIGLGTWFSILISAVTLFGVGPNTLYVAPVSITTKSGEALDPVIRTHLGQNGKLIVVPVLCN